jgi:hypothetical protein
MPNGHFACDKIAHAVMKYDNNPSYHNDEVALQSALATTQASPPSRTRVFAEVFLVAEWGSIPTKGFGFDRRIHVAGVIADNWDRLNETRVPCLADWLNSSQTMCDAINALVRIFPAPPCGQLSFMSKFLHWCRRDTFPIWDSRARRALGQQAEPPRTWDTYNCWSERIRAELAHHQNHLPAECCVAGPHPDGIRILDKALFIFGGNDP